jgi:hypothetical protein
VVGGRQEIHPDKKGNIKFHYVDDNLKNGKIISALYRISLGR